MLETHVLEFLLKYLPGGQKKKKERKKEMKKIDQFCICSLGVRGRPSDPIPPYIRC